MSSSRVKAVEALVAGCEGNEGAHALFGTSLEEIAAYMVIEFEMEPEEAVRDVQRAADVVAASIAEQHRVFDIASAVLRHAQTADL